jgi:hypothetical protein
MNRDVVIDGETGFLVAPGGDWEPALRTLLSDAKLRQRMGAAGRAHERPVTMSLNSSVTQSHQIDPGALTADRGDTDTKGAAPKLKNPIKQPEFQCPLTGRNQPIVT